ncbi:MAG: DUF6101 family protein [Pseudomonadota bacterium]
MRRSESGLERRAEQGCIALSSAEPVSVSAAPLPQAELRVEQRAVILHRRSRGGAPLRVAVPFEHYNGVSADIKYTGDGLTCSIVLAHANSEFDITLFSASDDENVLAEWNAWAQKLNMPLMIRTEHGDVLARPQFGPLQVSAVSPRRARNMFLQRRPRFLRARATGVMSEDLIVHAEREIIARN